MDILKPAIVHIGKRCYRKNPTNYDSSKNYEQEECYVPTSVSTVKCEEDEPCMLIYLFV